jgi:hypothetical protein
MKHLNSFYETSINKGNLPSSPFLSSRDFNSQRSKLSSNKFLILVNSTHIERSTKHSRTPSMAEILNTPRKDTSSISSGKFIRNYARLYEDIYKKDLSNTADVFLNRNNDKKLKNLPYKDKLDILKIKLFTTETDRNFKQIKDKFCELDEESEYKLKDFYKKKW